MTTRGNVHGVRSRLLRYSALVALVASSIVFGATSVTHADNNKGDVKLSQDGAVELPSGGSNEPHVCLPFFVQGYSLDPNASFVINFNDQGNPSNTVYVGASTATSDASGNFSQEITGTLPFTGTGSPPAGTPVPSGGSLVAGGHYKVSVFEVTSTGLTEVNKEKSKVFKVECMTSLSLAAIGICAGSSTTVTAFLYNQADKKMSNPKTDTPVPGATLSYTVTPPTPPGGASTSGTTTTDSSGNVSINVGFPISGTVVTVTYNNGGIITTNSITLVTLDAATCISLGLPPPPPPTSTPEVSSGELLLTGLLPIGVVLLYRRRRARHAMVK